MERNNLGYNIETANVLGSTLLHPMTVVEDTSQLHPVLFTVQKDFAKNVKSGLEIFMGKVKDNEE